MTNLNTNKYLSYLKELFKTPKQAFTYLEMKSLLDNEVYFSKEFESEHVQIVSKIRNIQERLQNIFDTYFDINSDYYIKPEFYYDEIIQKMKDLFTLNSEEENSAIHSILSLSPMQQHLLMSESTYQNNQEYSWQDVNNFILKYGLSHGPFEKYNIAWDDYIKQYNLNFLTINTIYNQLEASQVLVDEFSHIQNALHIDKKHIGQKKMGITLNQVNDHDAVFYPNEFMAIKFKNIFSIKNFLGHEWMHFTDRVMGMSLVKNKILPKECYTPEISKIDTQQLSALKNEKLNILYPNMVELIASFHQPLYLDNEKLASFKKFNEHYFKQFDVEEYIIKLQEFNVLKPIKKLDKQIQSYWENHSLYHKEFKDFLNSCFEEHYLPEFRCFIFAQFDTLMELKKINKLPTVEKSDEIDANLFYFYAKRCDQYLNQIESKIYDDNYTQNPLEMLARSFEIFLMDERNKRKDDKYLYFSLPLGIEKQEFSNKWKKIGQEIKKSYLILNPKPTKSNIAQKYHTKI